MQPDMASQRGALQLLDALDRKGRKSPAHPSHPMPTGFLEDLAARFENEGLEDMLGPSGVALSRCSASLTCTVTVLNLETQALRSDASAPDLQA